MLAAELIAPAPRPQLVVQPGPHRAGRATKAAADVAPVDVDDPPGRGHRPQRVTVRPPTDIEKIDALGLARAGAGRRELRRLAPPRRPRRRDAAGLDLAVPAGALAPRQRAGPDRAAGRRRDARAQGHGRPPDAAVLPADRRDRDAAGDPARRLDRDDRHRGRRGHRRRGQRQLARVRDLRLPRRDGRHRRRPPRRSAAGLRPGGGRRVRRQRPRRLGLLAARRARPPRRPRAVVRVGGLGGGLGRSRRSARSRSSARCSGS